MNLRFVDNALARSGRGFGRCWRGPANPRLFTRGLRPETCGLLRHGRCRRHLPSLPFNHEELPMTFVTGLSFLLATAAYPGEVVNSQSPEIDLAIGYKVKNHQLETVD